MRKRRDPRWWETTKYVEDEAGRAAGVGLWALVMSKIGDRKFPWPRFPWHRR